MIRMQIHTSHEIILSHGDLQPIDIMVRPKEGVVVIIDLELAGHYPEFCDPMKGFRGASFQCGYYEELLNIVPQRNDAKFVVDTLLTLYSKHWCLLPGASLLWCIWFRCFSEPLRDGMAS